jgi:hypothetical protein
MVGALLAHHGLELAQPIASVFRTEASGTSGVRVTVRLLDPGRADEARAVIRQRFGDGGVDAFDVA